MFRIYTSESAQRAYAQRAVSALASARVPRV